MALTVKQRYELKKFISELDSHKALHTELISVYIPAGYDLNKIINHLAQEQGTASNIKSASTRKNVISALERMIQHLRLFKQTPENGLAVFSGNVANDAYRSDKISINILFKDGTTTDIAKASDQLNIEVLEKTVKKYYLCYPK